MSIRACILPGGKNDQDDCQLIHDILKGFGVEYIFGGIISASSTITYSGLAKNAERSGIKVNIVCVGMAAHLLGVVAVHTVLPMIGFA